MAASRDRLLAGVASAFVVAAVVGGLLIMGSPIEARARRLDERRVEDLRRIAAAADMYWRRHERLAPSLAALAQEVGTPVDSADPVGQGFYAYRVTGSLQYELCSHFERSSEGGGNMYAGWPDERPWTHGAGRHCFSLRPPRKD